MHSNFQRKLVMVQLAVRKVQGHKVKGLLMKLIAKVTVNNGGKQTRLMPLESLISTNENKLLMTHMTESGMFKDNVETTVTTENFCRL